MRMKFTHSVHQFIATSGTCGCFYSFLLENVTCCMRGASIMSAHKGMGGGGEGGLGVIL